jgi:hypothetical protein
MSGTSAVALPQYFAYANSTHQTQGPPALVIVDDGPSPQQPAMLLLRQEDHETLHKATLSRQDIVGMIAALQDILDRTPEA